MVKLRAYFYSFKLFSYTMYLGIEIANCKKLSKKFKFFQKKLRWHFLTISIQLIQYTFYILFLWNQTNYLFRTNRHQKFSKINGSRQLTYLPVYLAICYPKTSRIRIELHEQSMLIGYISYVMHVRISSYNLNFY